MLRSSIIIIILFFTTQLFAQKKLYPYREKSKWGFCDDKLKVVIKPVYNAAYPFNEGMARVTKYDSVTKKNLQAFIDEKGKLLYPFSSLYYYDFIDGRSILEATNKKVGLVSKAGKILIDTIYKKIQYLPKSKVYKVTKNNLITLFSATGKQLFDFKYQDIDDATAEWHALLDAGGTYCSYVNRNTGKEMNIKGDAAEEFAEGLAAFKLPGSTMYGYINTNGETIIKPQFTKAKPFENGMAIVSVESYGGKGTFFIDKAGKPLFTGIHYKTIEPFRHGYALVDEMLMDKDGKFSIKNVYNRQQDLLVTYTRKSSSIDKLILTDYTGKQLLEVPYSSGSIGLTTEGNISYSKAHSYGLMDRKGKALTEAKYTGISFKHNIAYVYFYNDKTYSDVITGYLTDAGKECWKD